MRHGLIRLLPTLMHAEVLRNAHPETVIHMRKPTHVDTDQEMWLQSNMGDIG